MGNQLRSGIILKAAFECTLVKARANILTALNIFNITRVAARIVRNTILIWSKLRSTSFALLSQREKPDNFTALISSTEFLRKTYFRKFRRIIVLRRN